jgi:hypothetical protein
MGYEPGDLIEFTWAASFGEKIELAIFIGWERKDIKARAKILYNSKVLWVNPQFIRKITDDR